ncbi:MAG: Rrf2 family transcriptional regulator [Phycisphaeraceae bacterium]|nr:Rrf2 family transcriptional regulator [Phycisphaeraceae bacterium]
MYGKATENAIAAMSRLAEVYDGGVTRLSASDIAEDRRLQKPFVSKLLSMLSQAGLVTGTRGPGGGFTLARPPKEITLHDVYRLFERENESDVCPFGGGYCGVGQPCVLHDKLVQVRSTINDILTKTTFEDFRVAYQEEGLRPARRPKPGKGRKPRESFRARKPMRPR